MNQQGIDPPPTSMAGPKPSLPIARSAGTPYERPERARTSHACEPCRERKTKCDGERPSCRRCLHTGTGCHYGYGKGWRKRKTAEDLTATSRRLARYEALLNDIMPHVPPNVKAMIEEAREQDAAASSGGSETNEPMDTPRHMPPLSADASTSSGGTPRVSLPLPVPTSLGGQGPAPLPPPLARPFESMSPSHTASGPMRPNSASTDDNPLMRLPSITPHGLLVEAGGDGPSMLPQMKAETSHYPPPPDSGDSPLITNKGLTAL
ncbi:uncharacterized protein AB675_8627 [Cyphellophora attinorum]|uniref:Zn(2)-C6 fungal-type domain-containing protein n=1 Tax=Cyphellophora attinorum TaxID=1664694 RepID=A0A0N1P1M0_9EURO|nr:uncharacterized protein AB675_8627 [Phialophora attinorum]KPI44625.1 hypothetical protein AB675_8627 [Phialophora attinorum]